MDLDGNLQTINPVSRAFLIDLFTGFKEDLANQMQDPGSARPDPEKAGRTRGIYEALLSGLTRGTPLPKAEEISEFVPELAAATDKENEYERVLLEHQALEELCVAIAASRAAVRSSIGRKKVIAGNRPTIPASRLEPEERDEN